MVSNLCVACGYVLTGSAEDDGGVPTVDLCCSFAGTVADGNVEDGRCSGCCCHAAHRRCSCEKCRAARVEAGELGEGA